MTNFQSVEHSWLSAAIAICQGCDGIFDGAAGDVLSAAHFTEKATFALARAGRWDEVAEQLVDTRPIRLVNEPSLFRADDALQLVREELRKHESVPDPIASFYLWNRTRRNAVEPAASLLGRPGQFLALPYLDHDVYQFLSSLEPWVAVDKTFHTDAILRGYPEFADIPFARKAPLSAAYSRRLAIQWLGHFASQPKLQILNRDAVRLRLADCLIRPARATEAMGLGCRAALLQQVESPLSDLPFPAA